MIYFSKKIQKIFFKIQKTGKLGPKTETVQFSITFNRLRLILALCVFLPSFVNIQGGPPRNVYGAERR